MSSRQSIRNKCRACGLVNLATDERCRRCGAQLAGEGGRGGGGELSGDDAVRSRRRGLGRRLAWVLSMTLLLLAIAYVSLLMTSEPLSFEQRQAVHRAVALLDQRGFRGEAFLFGNLVSYRSTDNWWNSYVGHREAYAATNFPFEVVTLYPEFFEAAADDQERAAILLHESFHLKGAGERTALEGTWREKQRLGWTEERYGHTKVWNNTKELTMAEAPALFQCGPDGHSDCAR